MLSTVVWSEGVFSGGPGRSDNARPVWEKAKALVRWGVLWPEACRFVAGGCYYSSACIGPIYCAGVRDRSDVVGRERLRGEAFYRRSAVGEDQPDDGEGGERGVGSPEACGIGGGGL